MARISVFGLGYVGAVSIAILADNGHQVIGVDVNPAKVEMVNRGQSPIIEAGMPELMARGVAARCIRATTDAMHAVLESEISMICVGTPSRANGSLDLSYVERVSQQIGAGLAQKDGYHVIIARSTMLPGSTEEVIIPALERASGKQPGVDFGVCFNPEFLREGSSIKDFYEPPYTVIGSEDARAIAIVRDLYSMVGNRDEGADIIVTSVRVAEMVKYVSNAFHALKVTFANEIGNLCKAQAIDSHLVMDLFCQDTKLNISPAYLKPGFAFGGSCLPKDLRALLYHARHLDNETPVLQAILPSNQRQIDRAYQMVRLATGGDKKKRVGVLGFSFKAGTDDLRESPIVELVERLIGKGYPVAVYDGNVSLANLQGANRAYIEREIPHIASLMCPSVDALLHDSDVVVIGNGAKSFAGALGQLRPEQKVIDLVRIGGDPAAANGQVQGICW